MTAEEVEKKRQEELDALSQQNTTTNGATPPVATTPPPATEKPKSASWNMFRNVFGRDPITPEEEQKRMRKARTASMIGNLGNAIAAFANLFYAGKGAPAAQVPNAIQPDYKGFQDRVMAERAKAYELQRQQEATDLANQRYNEEMQLKKNADARAQQKADDEQKSAEYKVDLLKSKIEAQNARTQAMLSQAEVQKIKAKVAEAEYDIKRGNLQLGYAKLAEAERHHDALIQQKKDELAQKAAGKTVTTVSDDGFTHKETVRKEKPNKPEGQNGNDVKSGGTGSWGNMVIRKQK